jgi:hypothetical protein
MVTTATEEEYIPAEFWAALDLTPECMPLRSAIVDRLLELGKEDTAECIRWSMEKGRVPYGYGWHCRQTEAEIALSNIPSVLFRSGDDGLTTHSPLFYRYSHSAFNRLCFRWSLLTPEQKVECWNWHP